MPRTHTHPVCQNCISFDHIKNSCREQSSEFFGGSISPFHLSYPQYIGLGVVYAPKNRPKKMVQGENDGGYGQFKSEIVLNLITKTHHDTFQRLGR